MVHPDLVFAKSIITPSHLKGDFGEAVVGNSYLRSHLRLHDGWKPITARFGRQGIDELYIKYDHLGRPRDIMVTEVKYGSSQLGKTKDGIQLGDRWTVKRLAALAKRYKSAAQADVVLQRRPSVLNPKHQIDVNLSNGRKAYFWRENGNKSWKFDGPEEYLAEARKKTLSASRFIKSSSTGTIKVRKRLIEVNVSSGKLQVVVKDAARIDQLLRKSRLPRITSFEIALTGKGAVMAEKELACSVASQLKKKLPHLSDYECLSMGRKVARNYNRDLRSASVVSRRRVYGLNSLKAGLAGSALALAFEAASCSAPFDVERGIKSASLGFMSAGSGTLAGQYTTALLIENKLMHAAMSRTAATLGLPRSLTTKIAGSGAGGIVASLVFSYGGYFMGEYDSYTANKLASAGTIGVSVGTLAYSGSMAIVATYGTASINIGTLGS